jgi:hypothetical protein
MATKRSPYLLSNPFAHLKGSLRTTAAVNDTVSRFSDLKASGKMFASEVAAALVDKDPSKWDFFLKRWFFVEELNKEKTKVYEQVIGQLIELLDKTLKSRGEKFTRQDLEMQHPAYLQLKQMEAQVDDLFLQSTKGAMFSTLAKYLPVSSSMFPPTNPLLSIDMNRMFDDVDAEEVLKFPFDRKMSILTRCKLGSEPSWQKTCVVEGIEKERSREGHRPEDASYSEVNRVIQGLIQSAETADTQLKKNSYVDSAIDIAFRKKKLTPSYLSRATSFVTGRGGKNKTRRRKRNRFRK